MSKQLKISGQLVQDLTEAEQAQARANIGAASDSSLNSLGNTVASNSDEIAGIKSKLESMEWTKVDVDTTAASLENSVELFRVGNLVIGYYFVSGVVKRFNIVLKSASGKRYVCLTNGPSATQSWEVDETVWKGINPTNMITNCRSLSVLGYDCTADKGFQFEVLFCTDGTSPLVCRYRILEE